MAQLTGKGIPTRKTKGAIGDIYTDTATGKKYECTFAYRDNSDCMFDCQWKEIIEKNAETKKDVPKAPAAEKKEEVKTETADKEGLKTKESPVETPEKEASVQKPTPKNRTNYAAYGNKKDK